MSAIFIKYDQTKVDDDIMNASISPRCGKEAFIKSCAAILCSKECT